MRRRAGEAVATRMRELGLTASELAEKADLDPTTIRALLGGRRRVREETWERVLAAVNLPRGDVTRQMWAVSQAPTEDLIHELCRRVDSGHEVPGTGV